jgi:4-amino-4-deoxy-L-arabinose transferase-like glycosyltransferase
MRWNLNNDRRFATWRAALIGLVIFAALAGRLFFAFHRGPLVADEITYVRCAENVLQGRGFVIPAFGLEFRLYVAPAYPVFLIPFRAAFDAAALPRAVGIAQAILGMGTAALIYFTARRLGGRLAGAVAASAVLFHPYLAFFGSRVITETLSLFLFALFLSLYLDRNAGPYKLGAAGAVIALATLTRPVFLYLGILACACLLFRKPDEPWRKRVINAGVAAAALVAVLAPWTARNFALSGRLIPVTDVSGRVLYQGNSALAAEEVRPLPETLIRSEAFRERVAPFADDPVAVELAFQDLTKEKAMRAIADHKREFLLLSLRRFGHMFVLRPTLAPRVRGLPRNEFVLVLVTAFSILLYAAAAVGFFTAPGRLSKLFLPLACIFNTGMHAVLISLLRYRLPTDLIFTLVAGFGVAFLWEKTKLRRLAAGGGR